MIIARILEPRSKLATARGLSSETSSHTLGEELGVEEAGADELYSAMDWLLKRQQRIERRLAEQHLNDGSYKSVDLKVRPVHHRLADRVRAHVFLCMLAYYVEWHMRRLLAPLLFDDDDPRDQRSSPVQPARRSPAARAKASAKRTPQGLPVHSFQTLLADLATLTRNRVRMQGQENVTADVLARPTPLQAEALSLLNLPTMTNRTQ